MAWTAPIQHAVGDVLTANDWNTYVANNEIAIENSLQLVGIQTAVIGTPPALGAPNFKVQAGTIILTTNASGYATVTYPVAFATSVVTVIACPGDYTNNLGMTVVSEANNTLAVASILCLTNLGVGIASLGVRINWLAIGY